MNMRALAAAFLLCCSAPAALAQATYPERPVRLVVSYAAGNVADVLARLVADQLAAKWNQSVVIDNRPGQGGSLGAQMAVKAPPDGYTLLFSAMAAFGINPHVYPNVGYDPKKDFAPVVGIAYPDGLLVANVDLKAGGLAELVQLSKTTPGGFYYGSAGSGTVPHLNMEALKVRTGLVATHVPYKGAAAVTTDLIGGRIHLQQDALSPLLAQVRAGKVRPVVAMAKQRLAQLPDVPAIGEVVPGFDPVTPWMGILAPAGTPRAIVEKIHRDTDDILRQAAVAERMRAIGLNVLAAPPAEFARLVAGEYDRLGELVRALKLKVD
ncbi:MAG: tripartite tricarboxylate transporter substrate binding protein [Burkholderiales bacterium]|nr:tripartite tricarboxylate transporter substrate binding protein [Burkholderiales bacterium]